MGKGKKRAAASIVPPPQKVTSRKHARRLTSSYHDITHRLASAESEAERVRCRAELEEMGGVKAYQQASALNTALNSTSRWVARALRGGAPPRAGAAAPRVLEIGAVNTQLLDSPGLRVRAIDLHALDPRVEQCDFFSLPHGGELDASTNCTVAYDAVVCSMVLNCVPGERKRFEMLIGIRAQLKSDGRAFVTLPRSCLDHSFTLSEKSFCEALTAVGLPPSGPRPSGEEEERAGGEQSTETPSSSKIAFFDCVASLPDADAARRFMRMRHEARKAHRAAEGAGKGRDKGKGKWKGKSAGSAFDVDLGGYLGFGVRVERSHDDGGRSSREQVTCREEFLRQLESGELPARRGDAAAVVGDGDGEGEDGDEGDGDESDADADSGADAGGGGSGSGGGGLHALIDEEASRHAPASLDYSHWKWYGGREWHGDGEERPKAEWIFDAAGDAPPGSAQERSGWQWRAGGWTQAAPWPAAPPVAAAAAPAAAAAVGPADAPVARTEKAKRGVAGSVGAGRRKKKRPEVRLSSVLGCWWTRQELRAAPKRLGANAAGLGRC